MRATTMRPESVPAPSWRPPSANRRRLRSLLVGPVVVAAVIALVALGIKASYGGFSHTYDLTVDMSRAGQNLLVGSDVRERGVVIGHVTAIRLAGRHAQL